MDGRIVYLFRWMKADKPFYQSGEIVMIGEKRFMPRPPDSFQSLSTALQLIGRKYQHVTIILLTMGFAGQELAQLDAFVKKSTFIRGMRDISRPIGKNKDGGPRRVFLIGSSMDTLKVLKDTLIREHFEIVGLARSEPDALRTIYRMSRNIDLVLIEKTNDRSLQEETIKSVRSMSGGIKVLSFGTITDAPLSTNGHLDPPYTREIVVEILKKVYA
ncbi:MAG: hypothetical protein HZC28_00160 [Spirochaetes bacterium]|nr:hypothetical protein [Spirochaetota bacterium]